MFFCFRKLFLDISVAAAAVCTVVVVVVFVVPSFNIFLAKQKNFVVEIFVVVVVIT